jgi:hypothetical protein
VRLLSPESIQRSLPQRFAQGEVTLDAFGW